MSTAYRTLTIAAAASVSSTLTVPEGYCLAGFVFPSAYTNATSKLEMNADDYAVFNTVKAVDGAADYSFTIAAGYVPLNTDVTKGVRHVRLKLAGNEAADRTFKAVIKRIL